LVGRAWAKAGLAGANASGAPRRIEATMSAQADFAARRLVVEVRNPSYSMGFLLTFVDRSG
jgi:hypothetical protein